MPGPVLSTWLMRTLRGRDGVQGQRCAPRRRSVNMGTKRHGGLARQAPASREEGIRSPGGQTRLLEKRHHGPGLDESWTMFVSGQAVSRGSNSSETSVAPTQRTASRSTRRRPRGLPSRTGSLPKHGNGEWTPGTHCSSRNLPWKWTTCGFHAHLLAEQSPVVHPHFRGVASLQEARQSSPPTSDGAGLHTHRVWRRGGQRPLCPILVHGHRVGRALEMPWAGDRGPGVCAFRGRADPEPLPRWSINICCHLRLLGLG